MKRIICLILTSALAVMALRAQDKVSERVYVSSDCDVYIAGEDMFLSAFNFEMNGRTLSEGSSIAYVEICSAEGPVQTAKLALKGGRGAGVVTLSNTIPTGNYKLLAYTSQCFNEVGYDFEENAKTLTIINPYTTERSSSEVEIVDSQVYSSLPSAYGDDSGVLDVSLDDKIVLTNTGDKPVTLSVSLYNEDGLVGPVHGGPASFYETATSGKHFDNIRTPDYEGEIVRAKVRGVPDSVLPSLSGSLAFLSAPGNVSDVYCTKLDDEGNAVFYTKNIFGDKEIVLEMSKAEEGSHLDVVSPFRSVSATGIDKLSLCKDMEPAIISRSIASQVAKASGSDSLYLALDYSKSDFLLDSYVEYVLDDYTRFPLMEELFIEFVHELHEVNKGGDRFVSVLLNDSLKPSSTDYQASLVLLDGVPVLDHNKIFNYDPLLVKKIVVYPQVYNLGPWYFKGISNFLTYKGNLPGFKFDQTARVVQFQGCSVPKVSYLPNGNDSSPDMRHTILWHPLVDIGPGESCEINYAMPSYRGRFTLVVEGFDAGGNPQFVTRSITN